jgi:simple sugar transport system permease protein
VDVFTDFRRFAGLAGAFEVAGPIGQVLPSISPGYGFAAIIVASSVV